MKLEVGGVCENNWTTALRKTGAMKKDISTGRIIISVHMCSHDKEDLSSWQESYLCSDGFNILKLLRKCPGQRGNNVSRVWSFSQYNILSIWNNGGESGKLFWISNPRQLAGRTCLLHLDQQNSIIGHFLLATVRSCNHYFHNDTMIFTMMFQCSDVT